MPDALLRPLIYLLIAGGLFSSGWLTGCNYGSRELSEFKAKANALLESTKSQNAAKEAHDKQIAKESSDKYIADINKINLDLAAALKRPRLRDPYSRTVASAQACASAIAPQAEASTANIPEKPTGLQQQSVELSQEFSDFLIAEASRADELAVWANSCWAFVNHKDESAPY